MSFFTDLLTGPTLDGVKNAIKGFASAAGLIITDWRKGGVGEQEFETYSRATYSFSSVVAQTIRGFASLDTATDPGDPDPYDSGNVDLTPDAGFLSNKGANDFGTTRAGATFATGTVTFVNAGPGARSFAPYALTFTWTGGSPPSPAPTYRNALDSSIYTNPDGTVTVAAGTSRDIPVVADEIGSGSSAPGSSLSLTTTLVGCTATNAAAVTGEDHEAADVYRARCKQAPARISLGGAAGVYEYLAAKNLDGTPLLNANGDQVATTRVWVSEQSSTGTVDVYYADDSGGSSFDDVTASNLNITTYALATPGAITFTGVAATATSIHVVGTAKIRSVPGMSSGALQTAVKTAIVAALTEAFKSFPIGGLDQVSGAGVIYKVDLQRIAGSAYPGLYDVLVTTPSSATSAIALGHVPTLNSVNADWTVSVA